MLPMPKGIELVLPDDPEPVDPLLLVEEREVEPVDPLPVIDWALARATNTRTTTTIGDVKSFMLLLDWELVGCGLLAKGEVRVVRVSECDNKNARGSCKSDWVLLKQIPTRSNQRTKFPFDSTGDVVLKSVTIFHRSVSQDPKSEAIGSRRFALRCFHSGLG